MTTRVLITGGLGYLGGRIACKLAGNSGIQLQVGTHRKGVAKPEWLPGASEIVYLDLMSEEQLAAACRGVEVVVHLAALNEIQSLAEPGKALTVNGLGTLNLLRAAVSAGAGRFIYFSTAHVYGAPLEGTITEHTLPRPVHPYAITHRTAEDFVLSAHDRRELTGLVIRLSNGFGVPACPDVDRWTLIANDLCRQAVMEGKLVLKSPGLQRRDFITLEDVGRAVEHLIYLPADRCEDGLFNLGGNLSLQIIEVAERIASRCQSVLGFLPPILRPEPGPGEISPLLTYSAEKLLATGFALEGDFNREIDATLRMCQKEFGGRS